jgi:hypothetical protein
MIVFVSSEHFSWGDNQRSRGANRGVPESGRADPGVGRRAARKLQTWGALLARTSFWEALRADQDEVIVRYAVILASVRFR